MTQDQQTIDAMKVGAIRIEAKQERDKEWVSAVNQFLMKVDFTSDDNSDYEKGRRNGYFKALNELLTRMEAQG